MIRSACNICGKGTFVLPGRRSDWDYLGRGDKQQIQLELTQCFRLSPRYGFYSKPRSVNKEPLDLSRCSGIWDVLVLWAHEHLRFTSLLDYLSGPHSHVVHGLRFSKLLHRGYW